MHERVVIAPESPDAGVRAAIVGRARQRGFGRFVSTPEFPLVANDGEEVVVRRDDRLDLPGSGPSGVPVVRVADPRALEAVAAAVPDGGTLVLEWTGDRVIPLENAVAHRGRRFRVWTVARSPEEVPAALGALEHGADRVIAVVRSPEEVDRLEAMLERSVPTELAWVRVPLRSVAPAGLGDRVLVDTTSILRPEEGLLVGSAAGLLFHVASEAVGSEFSRARPFRVNAGAAHSYVLMADGTTRYLSELVAGDAVLVVAPSGPARSVRVGRIKIERRPLVVVTADDAGRDRTIFLQEAETVRLSTDAGRVAVTALRGTPAIDAVRLPSARHLGTAIEETIEER
jgi:3-dehydroquinate synthase II